MQQRSALLGLTKVFIKDTGIIALSFLGVYFIAMPLITSLMLVIDGEGIGALTLSAIGEFYRGSSEGSFSIFIFVLGIVLPFMLSFHMSLGVTRREHTIALLLMGTVLCLGLVLVGGILNLAFGSFNLLHFAASFPVMLSAFLGGWIIALGFQFRRVTTAVLGFVLVGLVSFSPGLIISLFITGTSFIVTGMDFAATSESMTQAALWVTLISSALICAILIPIILVATKRIAIKV